jgi:hypothetical protein
VTDHYTCKLCYSHYSECECPSYNEHRAWETLKDVPNVMGLIKRGEKDYLLVINSFRDKDGAAFNGSQLIPGGNLFVAQLSETAIFERWPTKWLFDKREKATQ